MSFAPAQHYYLSRLEEHGAECVSTVHRERLDDCWAVLFFDESSQEYMDAEIAPLVISGQCEPTSTTRIEVSCRLWLPSLSSMLDIRRYDCRPLRIQLDKMLEQHPDAMRLRMHVTNAPIAIQVQSLSLVKPLNPTCQRPLYGRAP